MVKYIFSILLLSSLLFSITSCGSDGPDCDDEAALESFIDEATQDYLDAAQKFATDPSDANCKSVADSLNDLIDDANSIRDCVPSADRAEFDEFIQDSRDQINSLPCG